MNAWDCPFCGEELDPDFLGVDLLGEAAEYLDWTPCCEAIRDEVGRFGFEDVFGVRLEDVASTISASEVREVVLDGDRGDSVVRRRLRGYDPGYGVSGWRAEVFAEVARYHRHHDPPQGWKFGVAVSNGRKRVGVAVVGRPVSRLLAKAEPGTLEVTRVCTWGETALRRNAASKLYGLVARRARKLGATKLVTYTLESEDGASLRAAGFVAVARTKGGSWNRPGRTRRDSAPTCPKVRWERNL